jgi:hypothetical protein
MRVALLVFAGCHCSDASEPAPAPPPPKPAPIVARPAPRKLDMQPVTVDTVQAILPAVPGDVLVPLALSPDGKQAHVAWCVPAADAHAAATLIADAMTKAGWTGASARGQAQTSGVSGDRDGFHLTVVVRGAQTPSCPMDQGKLAANATLFHAAP